MLVKNREKGCRFWVWLLIVEGRGEGRGRPADLAPVGRTIREKFFTAISKGAGEGFAIHLIILFNCDSAGIVWVMSSFEAFPSSWPGHHLIDDHFRTTGGPRFASWTVGAAPCLANEKLMPKRGNWR